MKTRFIVKKANLAGRLIFLSTHVGHLSQRWSERIGENLTDEECLRKIAGYLKDIRLKPLFSLPRESRRVLFIEKENLYIFLQKGTAKKKNEVKISTCLIRANKKHKVLVDEGDYCFILPLEGPLQCNDCSGAFKQKHPAYEELSV